ncbi:isoprenyl transferase [candidate division KSB1 bacterium]|nr:isoprenyl transferase [candidate division KSB1 bacterium]RQW05765.1 MAG: isoprenyl transferase [candidate division KSB1 bacterium]
MVYLQCGECDLTDQIVDIVKRIKERGNIPAHIGIIMDGNGRWAKKRGLPRTEGHKAGIESVRAVVEAAGEVGVKALTLYTFSKENWNRPQAEVSALMALLLQTIRNEIDELDAKNVRLMSIGDVDALPYAPRIGIKKTIKRLSKNTGLVLNLALSYGSRQEIINAIKKIGTDIQKGRLDPADIDEQRFATYLQTYTIGDPDLLIRTSGEQRISNFLLWQIAYAELYITPTLWPDFGKTEFFRAIENFQTRERRFGKVSEQLQA